MKYLRLYDLRNETVTIIPYPTKPVDANSDPQDIQSRKKRVRRRMIRRAKRAAFVIAEVATSLASGLDSDGTEAYVDALEAIQARYPDVKIMAITHDPEFKARFEQSVTITKDENGSHVQWG